MHLAHNSIVLKQALGAALGIVLKGCFQLLGGYGLAIVLFTILTKVVLFPVSLWTHRNSLKMVALMPELNRLKVKYYGDKDTIAEETQKLYKKERYHPLVSTIPMFVQLLLLIGVIGAVREMLAGAENILAAYPAQTGGITLFLPITAGCSALALGLAQNCLNPLQREQSWAGQWMTNGLSIAISLALGAFVPTGVGVYLDLQQPLYHFSAACVKRGHAAREICGLRGFEEKPTGAGGD